MPIPGRAERARPAALRYPLPVGDARIGEPILTTIRAAES